jgi:hypothetical protein
MGIYPAGTRVTATHCHPYVRRVELVDVLLRAPRCDRENCFRQCAPDDLLFRNFPEFSCGKYIGCFCLSNHSQLFLEDTFILSSLRERTSGIKLAGMELAGKNEREIIGGKERAGKNWRKQIVRNKS